MDNTYTTNPFAFTKRLIGVLEFMPAERKMFNSDQIKRSLGIFAETIDQASSVEIDPSRSLKHFDVALTRDQSIALLLGPTGDIYAFLLPAEGELLVESGVDGKRLQCLQFLVLEFLKLWHDGEKSIVYDEFFNGGKITGSRLGADI